MMSEKRFTFYYERGNEVVIEDNGKRLSNKQLVDLLNELDEENEQLQEKNKISEEDVNDYHTALFDLHKKYDKLEKRNEQLKSLVNACEEGQKSLMEEMKHNDEALDKIWEIMKDLYGVKDE